MNSSGKAKINNLGMARKEEYYVPNEAEQFPHGVRMAPESMNESVSLGRGGTMMLRLAHRHWGNFKFRRV